MKKHLLLVALIAATAFATTAATNANAALSKTADEFAIIDTILNGDLDVLSAAAAGRGCKLGKTREITVVVSEGPPRVEKKCKQTCKLNAETQKNQWYDDEAGCSTGGASSDTGVSKQVGGISVQ
jgi:hypothetical protein